MKLIEIVVGTVILTIMLLYSLNSFLLSKQNINDLRDKVKTDSYLVSLYQYSKLLTSETNSNQTGYVIFDGKNIFTGNKIQGQKAYYYECNKSTQTLVNSNMTGDFVFCEIDTPLNSIYNYDKK